MSDQTEPVQPITTPDVRLRIFVSSTLQELAEERAAVRQTISRLRLTPVMFELGARPHPPRELYRAYLAQSDVFVGIYWKSYGWVAPTESVSGLEDEYNLSGDRPKLIYLKQATDRNPQLSSMLLRIQNDDRAAYKHFSSAAELADLLADDLAVLLTERFAGSRLSRLSRPEDLRPARLPVAPNPIVGREAEVADLVALLADRTVRLVTVVGPGGIGKTRLALEVATGVVDGPGQSREGVWFVDLTPVTDPALVLELIAGALGVRPEGSGSVLDLLVDRVGDRELLLVLDNFEQVLPAAPQLARLLAACPGLTLLVTSRTALRLRGEQEVSLAPLPTPSSAEGPVDVEDIARSAAVRLFLARAHQTRPNFTLTPTNAPAVAELCRRLDGIPLALELAAAQLRVLTPEALLRRLGNRLDQSLDLSAGIIDLPSRQRTLRSTIEWSHSLLSGAERALLARLSVFAQSWTLEGAEAVGAFDGDLDVLGTLSSLVAQSLVNLDDRDVDTLRFRMLDTVRAYARERLLERGEQAAALDRLTQYLLGFAVEVGVQLQKPGNRPWNERVDDELEDIRSTLARAVESDDAETVVRLSGPLFTYWWSRGLLSAMSTLAEQAATLPSATTMAPEAQASLLWARGMFKISSGQVAAAEPLLRQLLQMATAAGAARLRAYALTGLALTAAHARPEEAVSLLDEALAAFRSLGDAWGLAFALSPRGQLALQGGDAAGASALHAEALDAATSIENEHLRASLLDQLGLDAMAAGDLAGGYQRFSQAADVHARLLDQEGSAYCLDGFATIALAQGRLEAAARLIGASAHARQLVGVSVWPGMQSMADQMVATVRGGLGETAFQRASAMGRQLHVTAALSYARTATAADAAAGG